MLASSNWSLTHAPRLAARGYAPLLIVLVLLLHALIFYGLMQLTVPQMPTQDKKTIQVRIVSAQPPRPIQPAPPTKAQVEPQPVVLEKPKPQPKVIATNKVTPKPAPVVPKVEQAAVLPSPQPSVNEQPKVQPTVAAAAKTETQPSTLTPKRVQIGGDGVQWSRTPRPNYTNRDLAGQNRRVVVKINADEKGNITQVRLTQGSGLSNLDDKILRAVRNAKFKPYKENGVALSIVAEQPFDLTLNPNG